MNPYHWKRKFTQLAVLVAISLIPALGLFRIDLASASFFILGHQVPWSNFPFIIGLALVAATAPVLTYMTIGTVWCGWACPQNFLSEWANKLTFNLLGKRADVRVDGAGMVVASSKNKIVNWLILGASIVAVSMALALVVFLFFYTPSDVWNFVASANSRPANMIVMYAFTSFLIFIDIAAIRYFLCDYGCLYRWGMRLFKTRDALHVTYDASRSSDCAKCNYCKTSCITAIDPTNIRSYDACIDCGECIDSCNKLHAKSGTPGLLKFELGEKGSGMTWKRKLGNMFRHLNWLVGAIFLAGCISMSYGVMTQKTVDPKKLQIEQAKIQEVAHVCNLQCEKIQSTCNGKNIAGCYRAAACKCECKAGQDPMNALVASWKQCAKNNLARALEMESKPK